MIPKIILSVVTILGLVGWNDPPGFADFEHGCPGYAHHSSSGHHCCGEIVDHERHYAHGAEHLRHLLKHQKEIGLTEEQIKKLNTIELDFDRAWIKTDAEIHMAERELHALVEEEKTELSAIETKVKQSEMLEVGLRMAAFKARRDALAVLTPEQWEKAKAAHEKRMHEMTSGPHGAVSGKGH